MKRWFETNLYEIKMAVFSLGLGGVMFAFLWLGMALAFLYE